MFFAIWFDSSMSGLRLERVRNAEIISVSVISHRKGFSPMAESKTTEQKPESQPVDERAVKLANASESAIRVSAQAEAKIAASHSLATYAEAGRAHLDSIKCGKAGIDYECEKRGVPTTWTPKSL